MKNITPYWNKATWLCLLFFCIGSVGIFAQDDGEKDLSKACIDYVMAADSILGGERNHACKVKPLSEVIGEYVAGLEKLNFGYCPTEFTAAFKSHMEAWTAMIEVTDQFPDLRGEMHDLFDEIEKSEHASVFKAKLKDIWDTWNAVEKAMAK